MVKNNIQDTKIDQTKNEFKQFSEIKEFQMNYNNLSSDWIEKFKNYNLDKYKSDIEKFGIQKTWDNICNFTLNYDSCCEFFNVSMFGELYELALAMIDKNQKKENGQYYTPGDVASVLAGWFKALDAYNMCDVACGTGKLILTYLELISKEEATKLLEEGRVYLYDTDETALQICQTAILMKYGKRFEKNLHIYHCDFLNKYVHLPENSKVICNPPYAGFSTIPNYWAKTQIQSDSKELYVCFIEKIISESEKSVIISPYSFIGGNKFYSLRLMMSNYSGFIVSFDNVPGNIFCGKKHGVFNTNTSNSVRAAITVVQNNNPELKGFRLSPLIRFKNEERKNLLECKTLESELSDRYQTVSKDKDAYIKCQKELLPVFDEWVNKSDKILKDIVTTKEQNYKIYVPNTCRYFTTASSYKLKRAGIMDFSFKEEGIFEFVYCLINSSFAYWWWRIFDGGITYSKGLVQKLPIFISLLSDEDKRFFKDITREMMEIEKDCIVTKLNSGTIQENIKFPLKYRNQLNRRFLDILGFGNLDVNVFDRVHKNSFFDN